MWELICWICIFTLTSDRPILRSYFNCLSCLVLSILSQWYLSFTYLSLRWTAFYYLIDTFNIIWEAGFASLTDIFLYHHLGAIVVVRDALFNGSIKYLREGTRLGICFEFSTIFLNFMQMSKEKDLYLGWYPDWSQETHRKLFAISFLISRIGLAVPLTVYILSAAPMASRLGLIFASLLNLWWAWMIIRRVSKNVSEN